MRRYLLDTGIAGCYIDRRSGVYERARAEWSRGTWVGIAHSVLAELASGVEVSRARDRNMQRLRLALASWKLWPVTEEATFEYGRIAAELRRIGRMIGQNDIMIAAIALTLGNTTVVTMDSDLAAVPGLTVENWAAEPSEKS
jgi:tRNA(fMet)-specific endonuclease VapC